MANTDDLLVCMMYCLDQILLWCFAESKNRFFFSFMYLSTQLCHIDCQAEGGIPSYSFALMVIFFLQQRKDPILPVYLGPWVSYWERATLYLCSLANNQR